MTLRDARRFPPWLALLMAGSLAMISETAPAGSRVYIGDGVNSCGAWTQERARESPRVQLWKGWILGYVSGANTPAEHPEIISSAIDGPAVWAWVDNYCRSNPLETIQVAAMALVRELLHRAEPRDSR
jgi:hypothetical protein